MGNRIISLIELREIIRNVINEKEYIIIEKNNTYKEDIKKIENLMVEKYKELQELNDKKHILQYKLNQYESILNPKIVIKKMITNRPGVEDYYRAETSIYINNRKERIISYLGLCKDFEGRDSSEELKELAKEKMRATLNKKFNIIIQD